MAVVIDGTTGISTPAETVLGNLSYTGTLTGNGGIVNLGSGQVYKDASGNVGIGTSSPGAKLDVAVTGPNLVQQLVGTSGVYSRIGTATSSFYTIHNGTTDTFLYTAEASALRLGTNSTERARIDSSGNLLVGTTSNLAGTTRVSILSTGDGSRTQVGNGYSGHVVGNTSGTAQYYASLFYNNNFTSLVGNISVSGSTTSYVTTSDYRLKEDFAPMAGALAKVALLKPCTYKWKVDGSDGQGFIAHELAEVCPDAVTGEKDAVDADGNPQYQGIDTSFLVATLAAAIQELKAIVDTQATTITALTARITALEAP